MAVVLVCNKCRQREILPSDEPRCIEPVRFFSDFFEQ